MLQLLLLLADVHARLVAGAHDGVLLGLQRGGLLLQVLELDAQDADLRTSRGLG